MKFAAISSIVTSFLLTRFYTKRKVFHGASETEASDNTIQGSIPWVSVHKRKNRVHSIFHTTLVCIHSISIPKCKHFVYENARRQFQTPAQQHCLCKINYIFKILISVLIFIWCGSAFGCFYNKLLLMHSCNMSCIPCDCWADAAIIPLLFHSMLLVNDENEIVINPNDLNIYIKLKWTTCWCPPHRRVCLRI